jgi:type I restriction enzyme S subunit
MVYNGANKLGDFFTSRRERGAPGLQMLSVTMNKGVVTRESLDRKMETNLSDEEHLLVRKDDIVYNMMRMWQGASGLADRDGLISPAYVVVAPKKEIDSLYASYLFKSSRLIFLFGAYSYGLTSDRLRLYFNDFKRIPVNIPSLPEQRKIGKIIFTWDKAIAATEKLLFTSKNQKKALIQQLLNGKTRFLGFEEKWRDSSLSSFVEVIVSPVDKKFESDEVVVELCNYTDVYQNNYITSRIKFMRATAKEAEIKKYLLKKGDVVITKDSETPGDIAVSALVSEELNNVLCGYHLAILRPNKHLVDSEFLNFLFSMPSTRYYFFTLATGATRFGLSIGGIKKAYFSMPSLEEQKRIAQVLTTADREIEVLQQKLVCLKQEKKALMQQLLTGKRRLKVSEA